MAENIFAEIYNKILGLFGQAEPKEDSKNTAVSRLRLVLMQDRTNLTPEIMHRMRKELIEVLSTYVELDKEALELNFEQEGEQMALMLSIPVVRAKDEAEIEAAIKEKEEAKISVEDSDEDNKESEEDDEEENTNESSEDEEENDEDDADSSENDEEAEEDSSIQEDDSSSGEQKDSESEDEAVDSDEKDVKVESKKESKVKKEEK